MKRSNNKKTAMRLLASRETKITSVRCTIIIVSTVAVAVAEVNFQPLVMSFTSPDAWVLPKSPTAATAAELSGKKCCVWQCKREGFSLYECPLCKCYVHWDCYWQGVYYKHDRIHLLNKYGNTAVVCSKRCFDEYRKFLGNQKQIQNNLPNLLPINHQPSLAVLPSILQFARTFPENPSFDLSNYCASPFTAANAPFSPADALLLGRCCVRGCIYSGQATTVCQRCKRFVHEECFRERILGKHQLKWPTDISGNKIVVCSPACLREYQLLLKPQSPRVDYCVAADDHVKDGEHEDNHGVRSPELDRNDCDVEMNETQDPSVCTQVSLPSTRGVILDACSANASACIEDTGGDESNVFPEPCTEDDEIGIEETVAQVPVVAIEDDLRSPSSAERKCCVQNCYRGEGHLLQECQRCKRYIHEECFRERIIVGHQLDHPKDENGNFVVVCTKKCHRRYLQNRLWCNDGKRGPEDPVSSEAVLVDWLAAGDNYRKYRDPKHRQDLCKEIAERINASGVIKNRTGRNVARKITRIESQMQDALELEGKGAKKSPLDKELLNRCRYFDVLAPIFRDNCLASKCSVVEDTGGGDSKDEHNLKSHESSNSKNDDVVAVKAVAPALVATAQMRSLNTRGDVPMPNSGHTEVEDVGGGERDNEIGAAILTPDSDDVDIIDTEKAAAQVPAARYKVILRSATARRDAPLPAEPAERVSDIALAHMQQRPSGSESNVSRSAKGRASRQSKKRKRPQDTQPAAPEVVRSMELERHNRMSREAQNELDRLQVTRLKRKLEWEQRNQDLKERAALLNIDLKKIEVNKQRLAYRTELDARYRDLRQQQNRSYAEIANLFPEMIELFPPEEKNNFNK